MPMKSPLHPGRIVKHECLEPLNLTVKRAAKINIEAKVTSRLVPTRSCPDSVPAT
jgi:plasmid maintenance system antidote protein VapI